MINGGDNRSVVRKVARDAQDVRQVVLNNLPSISNNNLTGIPNTTVNYLR